MARCKTLTNSVPDFSPELAAAYDVHVIPDASLYKNREYLNDIQPRRLYDLVRGEKALSSASHPSPFADTGHFGELSGNGEILCIVVSAITPGSDDASVRALRPVEEDGTGTGVSAEGSIIGLVFEV